ncbi:hypothetical protein [Paraclostridium sordellii]|uniref:hypothetical protein n=1 Tax=Paraclostridium sordellii TaxID=1505 RepID=UPI0003855F52|nr:hypothetical protein [Paeniclostridium sordellii]EPZ56240.1 putative membrane protein [[Clostridium] sordellii VPI 9048] [Paeniclostridium sordellii VPI 9048]CEK38034.1 putative membrane protein [[Clostridium] sordellii] [Paeniclostridium sordellii]
MFKIVFGMFFIVVGLYFIYLGLKLQRTKDLGLIKNKMVNIDKIKDGYIRFNIKLHMVIEIIYTIQGILCILSRYFVSVDNLYSSMSIVVIITIFVYTYKVTFKAPKF